MTLQSSKAAARKLAKQQQQQQPNTPGNGFMNYLDQVSRATDYMLTHPISDIANALSLFAGLVTDNGTAARNAATRLLGWQQSTAIASLKQWTAREVAALEHQIVSLQAFVIKLNKATADALWKYINDQIATEQRRRRRGDRDAERYARLQTRALHHLIEREAAGAYREGYQGRIAVITRLADYLAAHNPVVRTLTRDLIAGALDLLSVDNPLARIALGFVVKRIIERLGLDRIAGAALRGLLDPLLGSPRPHDLPGVIADVSKRLGALESQQAQFFADGGAEVEQAGAQWRDITSPLVDVALVAWLAQGIADPQRWASELTGAIEPVMTGAQDVFTRLMREG